jgi:hypothetical protein
LSIVAAYGFVGEDASKAGGVPAGVFLTRPPIDPSVRVASPSAFSNLRHRRIDKEPLYPGLDQASLEMSAKEAK